MRMAIWALAFGCAVLMIGTLSATAGDYPFCIKGGAYDLGFGDCSFSTYQQCQVTASGRDSWCDANPFFKGNTDIAPRASRPRRRY